MIIGRYRFRVHSYDKELKPLVPALSSFEGYIERVQFLRLVLVAGIESLKQQGLWPGEEAPRPSDIPESRVNGDTSRTPKVAPPVADAGFGATVVEQVGDKAEQPPPAQNSYWGGLTTRF